MPNCGQGGFWSGRGYALLRRRLVSIDIILKKSNLFNMLFLNQELMQECS